METGLMIGRIVNLAPTYVFLNTGDYISYFNLLGLFLLFSVPFYVVFKKEKPRS
jgi:hypothetical protein